MQCINTCQRALWLAMKREAEGRGEELCQDEKEENGEEQRDQLLEEEMAAARVELLNIKTMLSKSKSQGYSQRAAVLSDDRYKPRTRSIKKRRSCWCRRERLPL